MGNSTELTPEAQTFREYRYLLRTAPIGELEAAHGEALAQVSDADREAVLRGVQDGLVAGARLTPSDVAKVARLLTLGERRNPGAFLRSCDPGTLLALAQATVRSEAASSLLDDYDLWDGVDPQQADTGEDHGGDGASETLGIQVNSAKELARLHAAQTGVGAGGAGF